MAITNNPELGVLLHAIGGLAAASFYIPFRGVKGWSWESFWLVGGIVSWIITPWVASYMTIPDPVAALRAAPMRSLLMSYVFGALWGIGGLTFGLSMRYLGMSLGYALALGACAAFGTLIPPMYFGTFADLFQSTSGVVVLLGVAVCLVGIAVCGVAGMRKEAELPDKVKRQTIREFSFKKGVWIAMFCGIMSACMAFAIAAGKPIADAAVALGAEPIFSNNPTYIIIMAGGFTSNLIWCLYLNIKNGTGSEYFSVKPTLLVMNVIFCALAGATWYLQFFFYGMGTIKLGEKYEFSSWTLHMAFIIVFSNLWALAFREWSAASAATRSVVFAGIIVLIVSTIVIGYGNKIGEPEATAAEETAVAAATK